MTEATYRGCFAAVFVDAVGAERAGADAALGVALAAGCAGASLALPTDGALHPQAGDAGGRGWRLLGCRGVGIPPRQDEVSLGSCTLWFWLFWLHCWSLGGHLLLPVGPLPELVHGVLVHFLEDGAVPPGCFPDAAVALDQGAVVHGAVGAVPEGVGVGALAGVDHREGVEVLVGGQVEKCQSRLTEM